MTDVALFSLPGLLGVFTTGLLAGFLVRLVDFTRRR